MAREGIRNIFINVGAKYSVFAPKGLKMDQTGLQVDLYKRSVLGPKVHIFW